MTHFRTDDVRIEQGDELLAPMQLMRELSATDRSETTTFEARKAICVLLIHLGTNDIGEAETFEANMRTIVEFCIMQGIIPILATKADRVEGEDNHNNQIVINLPAECQFPLWNFDAVAVTLPGHGLDEDQIHLTKSVTNNYTDPDIWSSGYPVSDLTALLMLDAVRQAIEGTQP